MNVFVTLLATALFALSALAEEAEEADNSSEVKEQKVGGVSPEDALRLEALGYVDFSPEVADLSKSGVVLFEAGQAAPGHTLIISSTGCVARLIDLSGRELHRWTQRACVRWWSADLMRNGDLVVNGGRREPGARLIKPGGKRPIRRFAARIAWSGERLWMRGLKAHHQLDWTPSQEILVLTESPRPLDDVKGRAKFLLEGMDDDAKLVVHDNELVFIGPEGEVRDTLSLLDAATTGQFEFDFLPRDELLETPGHLGLFHANSAYAMDQPHLVGSNALFRKQNILVTSRNQNRIFIVDRQSRSLVWEWGKGVLEAPHNAMWLGNGNILVLDNGVERKTSRVLEVDPTTGKVVWKYPDKKGSEFYCETRGLVQRLANGNTLITNAVGGEAFEVTPAGDTVWQYFAKVVENTSRRPVLMSVRRYSESWVEPLGNLSSSRD